MFDLTPRVFLVTGASSGLGQHFARVLARHGASVALCARRGDRLEELAAEINNDGGTARAVTMDVTNVEDIHRAFDEAEQALGPISGLINNAGIASEKWVLEVDETEWESVMTTNLTGAWWAAHEAARRMVAHKIPGNIVNIASILGFRVEKTTAVYAIAKAGLIQMTKAMALELTRDNIQVNALAPGYFNTELNSAFFASEAGRKMIGRIPQNRIGALDELDAPLLLLASNASTFMTGAVITIDGGQSLTMA